MNQQCPDPVWVNTTERLTEAVNCWAQATVLALDTEFMRTDTFYPYLGLIQVSDGVHCWLIDPLAELDLQPVKAMLTDPNTLKVFHACSEDLEILQLTFDTLPTPLVDTQIAAALVGLGFSRGYNALLNEVLDIEMDKGETRSNWLQRPLTSSQRQYAAEDVYFLFYLYQNISGKLEQQQRSHWLAEETEALLNKAANPITPQLYYRRVKGAWKLDMSQLNVLQQLAEWRENEAMKRNMPRNRIVKDRDLFSIARRLPEEQQQLAEISELHPGQLRRYGSQLLGIVQQVLANPDEYDAEPLPEPLEKEARSLVKAIKEQIRKTAESLDVAQEILATKQDVEQLARHALYNGIHFPARMEEGWRADVLTPQIEAVLDGFKEPSARSLDL